MKPVSKDAWEIENPEELGTILRTAWKKALTFPYDLVMVALPMDIAEREEI